ncbi:hypothetical protein JOD54_004221 [Actinokineospora baliensis]|uniref:hypothetical protein n=1 Tax=Actinokineospora baliensis TaxID=547056 RepID=UPI00195C19FF|nr:hypothetical protein [Actinokineospora baliensis]MBM7774017.1 hypothetical protein [Actinokineospora baliensis]
MTKRITLTVVTALFFGGVTWFVTEPPAGPEQVHALVGTEKVAFFRDPRVQQVFLDNGKNVQVEGAGSRDISRRTDLDKQDFLLLAGQTALDPVQDRLSGRALQPSMPWDSPLVVVTSKTIADGLVAGQAATPISGRYYRLNLKVFLDLALNKDKRWNHLGVNGDAASKRIYATTTDVCTSNSAGAFLGLVAYVLNNNSPPVDKDLGTVSAASGGQPLHQALQSYVDLQGQGQASTKNIFDDYLNGIAGPLVVVYEHQFLEASMHEPKSIRPDMALLYFEPLAQIQPTFVALSTRGEAVTRLIEDNEQLRNLAAEYGLHIGRTNHLADQLAKHDIRDLPSLSDESLGSGFSMPKNPVFEKMLTEIGGCRK